MERQENDRKDAGKTELQRFVKKPTLDIEDIRELYALTDEVMDFMSSAARAYRTILK